MGLEKRSVAAGSADGTARRTSVCVRKDLRRFNCSIRNS